MAANSELWTQRYQPKTTGQVFGQRDNVMFIKRWLASFEPSKSRPLFIHGPPGIGKTTVAHLIAREAGYNVLEFNASDQRNKGVIRDVINVAANNCRISFTMKASRIKDLIILDEIDGMAGNEDRGGIAQLIIELKNCKKPFIFICNDGQSQKLRSLKDKCEVLEFRKPNIQIITALVDKICQGEGLNRDLIDVEYLAQSTDYDIRQIINTLSMFTSGIDGNQSVKTTRMNAFEATKKAFTKPYLSMEERFECFFSDYNIMPQFMFENYIKFRPAKGDALLAMARAADSLSISDLFEKEIRSNQNWSLLNQQALFSTVLPSKNVACDISCRIDFPQFLGKLSNLNKRSRYVQELNAHMCLKVRSGLDADYLQCIQDRLSGPLLRKDGPEKVMDFMEDYCLLREDFNYIMELGTWSTKPDPMTKVDGKTKAAFTRAYKKRSIKMPYYSEEQGVAKKRKAPSSQDATDSEDEDGYSDDEQLGPSSRKRRTV